MYIKSHKNLFKHFFSSSYFCHTKKQSRLQIWFSYMFRQIQANKRKPAIRFQNLKQAKVRRIAYNNNQ